MTGIIDDFIGRARDIPLDEAATRLGLKVKNVRGENAQPCPVTGGKDRFSFNPVKKVWHCRQCDRGGHDAIGMAAHNLELDVKRRDGLLAACAAVLGEEIPAGGERESDEDRDAREKRLAARRATAQAEAVRHEAEQADYREKERRKARGIIEAAADLYAPNLPFGRLYLQQRGCGVPPDARWLRCAADLTYWHGKDDRGFGRDLHSGPAMVAPFIALAPDLTFEIIGCHITWIDLANPPKCRPALVDPETGEFLPTKKMRGTKKGGVIPLAGALTAERWLGAEGIENTLAFARYEGFRADTFYFAAGDLGNMAGPADPRSKRAHPTLKKADKAGKLRPVMVPGPVPRFGSADEPDAMVIPDHVTELVLLGDGDSEPVMTAAAMVRAKARHARPGRLIPIIMPRGGTDFAAMLAGRDEAYA